MRKICYSVATSLDGFIAGPNGETDWIVMAPEVDFSALWARFDTLLMGRRTYEAASQRFGTTGFQGKHALVASRTWSSKDHPGITLLPDLNATFLEELRKSGNQDVWVMGGGELSAAMLAMDLLDEVEVMILPIVLGDGVPLVRRLTKRVNLALEDHIIYPSGIVTLRYSVLPGKSTDTCLPPVHGSV